MIRIKSVDTF